MPWYAYVSLFFGGMFLLNSLPHLLKGVCGEPFQSPFAKPPGEGLSSARINVAWGFFNLVVAYVLLIYVSDFDLRNVVHVGVAGIGFLLLGLLTARLFGRFHGGNI